MSKILVCDDDFVMLKLIENKLKSDGYHVFTATDGAKAIELLESENFDIMITDMHMPHATGLELIDFVRNELALQIHIIVLTKDGSENTTEDSYKIGADDYIIKPVNMNILSIKIKKVLDKR